MVREGRKESYFADWGPGAETLHDPVGERSASEGTCLDDAPGPYRGERFFDEPIFSSSAFEEKEKGADEKRAAQRKNEDERNGKSLILHNGETVIDGHQDEGEGDGRNGALRSSELAQDEAEQHDEQGHGQERGRGGAPDCSLTEYVLHEMRGLLHCVQLVGAEEASAGEQEDEAPSRTGVKAVVLLTVSGVVSALCCAGPEADDEYGGDQDKSKDPERREECSEKKQAGRGQAEDEHAKALFKG